ncbi:hypothetical protein [Sphingosinicella sp. BN140058]|uniref:hypothetical protein n=1 Tax=Sphingosinicella sp. BN140058 TaxID=1892855 RepID=UPI0010125726|nr:hypothetical protein [Sphingosinicella sp. BN140058]QAY76107.1 hypothetical protein ETR14_05865 [Sphingosinicella sp. BN140058]
MPNEDLIVGIFAAGLLPWIGWTVSRGLRAGRLPIGRGHIDRAERRGAFNALLFLYGVAALLVAAIALDLLFHIDIGLRP